MQLTINLPENVYHSVLAHAREIGVPVADIVADTVSKQFQRPPVAPTRPAMLRETAAFVRMHPELVTTYLNQYVAVTGGELVDHDVDIVALADRVEARFPEQVVLIRRVEVEADRILRFRSPRFIADE